MDLTTGFTVIVFDINQNRAIRTSPYTVSLLESESKCQELKNKGLLAMSVHESTLSCIDIFEKEQFEEII